MGIFFKKRTGASMPTPSAGKVGLYVEIADGLPYIKDESGAATSLIGQPQDSDLTAIAALSTTSYGRALLTLADAAAGRTAFALGTASTHNHGDYDLAGAAAAAQSASQPVDSDLTAIAALATTSFGRSFLALADAAAARTLIATLSSSEIAAAYQPLDADLTSIAALATTGYGRGLLTLADAAAARTSFSAQQQDADLDSIAALATTGYGRGLLTLADAAANTAQLNLATSSLKGLFSNTEKLKLAAIWYDVTQDFGADNLIGNGSSDNTTKINNILSAVPANSVLFWPPGDYRTNGGHSVTKTLLFIGGGRSISVITATNASNTIFTYTSGAAGTGFEQIRVAASSAALRTAGYAIDFANAANAYIQQCDILYQWSSVHSSGGLQFIDDANIREGGANASNGQFVLVDGTGDRYFRRVTTDNPTDPTGFAGLRLRRCASCVIADSNIINSTNCLDIVPNGGAGTEVASVMGLNTFFDSSVVGVNIQPASASDTAQRIRFANCWFGSQTTAGVQLGHATNHPTANVNSVDFVACDFPQSPVGIDAINIAEWSVRASRIMGCSTAGVRVVQGAQAGVHAFSISDNIIGNVAGFGVNGVGITIAAGTYNRYQILANRGLETNTTKGIIDSGSIGPLGVKNINGNMGALVQGSQPFLSSGAAALIAGGARGAVTVSTTDTFMFTVRIPANSVAVGQTIRITVLGQHSGAGTPTFKLRAGATGTIASDTQLISVAGPLATTTLQWVYVTAFVYVVALGPTATVSGIITGQTAAAGFMPANAVAEVLANVPTTADWFITFSAADSVGTFTIRDADAEIIA